MKAIQVFIFCLLVLFLGLTPVLALANSQAIVFNLSVTDIGPDMALSQDLINQILDLINNQELILKPIIFNQVNSGGIDIQYSVSGSLEQGIIVSIF